MCDFYCEQSHLTTYIVYILQATFVLIPQKDHFTYKLDIDSSIDQLMCLLLKPFSSPF